MDPYLEEFWPSVHNTLLAYVKEELNTHLLPEDLRADMTERVAIGAPSEPPASTRFPDIFVAELQHSPASSDTASVALLEQVNAQADPDEALEFTYLGGPVRTWNIQITDRTGGKVITVIELLSLSNKLVGRDRDDYLTKRNELIEGDVNIVEIDLVRRGRRPDDRLDPSLAQAKVVAPYLISIRPAGRQDMYRIYPVQLNKPIPTITLPLRKTDPIVRLKLQPLLDRVVATGRYPTRYDRPLDPPLSDVDTQYARQLLAKA